MAFLRMTCPACNEKIPMDDTLDKGFCMYCGASFWVRDEMQRFQAADNWGYHVPFLVHPGLIAFLLSDCQGSILYLQSHMKYPNDE